MATIQHASGVDGRALARARITNSLARRSEAGSLLAGEAEQIARACHSMSERFHRGGRLFVFGAGVSSTDAQHVAVEFLHPVIVGKRTLPAVALTNDVATITGIAGAREIDDMFAHQIRSLATPDDIALGIDSRGSVTCVTRALEAAHDRKLLTIAMTAGENRSDNPAIDFELVAASDDPLIVKEIQVTTYHILWELVHVFFERPGVFAPGFTQ